MPLSSPPTEHPDCCASPALCHHMNCSMHKRPAAARPSCHGESSTATQSEMTNCECSVSSAPLMMDSATGAAGYFQLPEQRPLPPLASRILPDAEFQPRAAAGFPARPELPPRPSC